VHQILFYDTDWNEHEVYGRRFRKIVERSGLIGLNINVEVDVVAEFGKRVEKKLNGKEPLDKSLIFYKIITCLCFDSMSAERVFSELSDFTEEGVLRNLIYLEQAGFIIKKTGNYELSRKTKKIYIKIK